MTTLAIANLKGGVGKSTLTLIAAEHWAFKHNLKVLVVDLDPQGSVSEMLLGRHGLQTAQSNLTTTSALFETEVAQIEDQPHSFIVWRGSNISELRDPNYHGRVSVLPSVPELWIREYEFDRACIELNQDPALERRRILQGLVWSLRDEFDVVLLDCPPGFGTLSRAALGFTDKVVSPTIADAASTSTLQQFVHICLREIAGVDVRARHFCVITKFLQNNESERQADLVREGYTTMRQELRQRVEIARLAETFAGVHMSFKAKYHRPIYNPIGRHLSRLCDELKTQILGT